MPTGEGPDWLHGNGLAIGCPIVRPGAGVMVATTILIGQTAGSPTEQLIRHQRSHIIPSPWRHVDNGIRPSARQFPSPEQADHHLICRIRQRPSVNRV